MSTTSNRTATGLTTRGRYVLASRPLARWRTIDLVVTAFLGVAFGLAYWAWGIAYAAPSTALSTIFPPLAGITGAPWLMAGVVGGLVVRRPGAALFAETLAAVVSMIPGTKWGVEVLISGLLQGIGAEIGFAILGYAAFGLGAALLAGALSAPLEAVYEWFVYWTDWDPVSYTHLDVYKRQGPASAPRPRRRRCGSPGPGPRPGRAPRTWQGRWLGQDLSLIHI